MVCSLKVIKKHSGKLRTSLTQVKVNKEMNDCDLGIERCFFFLHNFGVFDSITACVWLALGSSNQVQHTDRETLYIQHLAA